MPTTIHPVTSLAVRDLPKGLEVTTQGNALQASGVSEGYGVAQVRVGTHAADRDLFLDIPMRPGISGEDFANAVASSWRNFKSHGDGLRTPLHESQDRAAYPAAVVNGDTAELGTAVIDFNHI